MFSRWSRAVAVAVALGLLAGPSALARPAPAPCTGHTPGRDWATYGSDLQGSQRQDREETIGVDTVAGLAQAWLTPEDTGYQSPPPIVSGGCVFINTNGHIEAFDLQTGATVWKTAGNLTEGTFAVMV